MTQNLKIDDRPAAVLAMLSEAGFEAHLVGGAVRNALLGQPVKDFDISTDARPDQVTDLFEGHGLAVLPTGVEHGTVTVMYEGEPFEVTTWRRDVATDGRRAVVAFADRIEEDALRRDFTMNALYADASGRITDPTGQGLADIAARRVRFIGNAEDRIREDALRILRFFRFAGRFAARLDHASADFRATAELAHLVDGLSRERVGQEMLQILSLPDCGPVLDAMQRAGVLDQALPGTLGFEPKGFAFLVRAEHGLGLAPCPLRRLALLVAEPPKDALRLSNPQVRDLGRLLASRNEGPEVQGYRLGEDLGASAHALFLATGYALPRKDDMDLVRRGAARKMPVGSRDLMDRFQGPALGDALRRVEQAWVESGFGASRTELLDSL